MFSHVRFIKEKSTDLQGSLGAWQSLGTKDSFFFSYLLFKNNSSQCSHSVANLVFFSLIINCSKIMMKLMNVGLKLQINAPMSMSSTRQLIWVGLYLSISFIRSVTLSFQVSLQFIYIFKQAWAFIISGLTCRCLHRVPIYRWWAWTEVNSCPCP